jgi:hypothetical protein
MRNFKPIFYNRYCGRAKKRNLIHALQLEGQGNSGYVSFLLRVNKILSDIIWELALKFVPAVLFINIPVTPHSICGSNTLCTGFYFL